MLYSLFTSGYICAYDDLVDDPTLSRWSQQVSGEAMHNVIAKKVESYTLDSAATRAVTLANYVSTEWTILILKVMGEVKVNTVATNLAGGAVTGRLRAYGTSVFPGILMISTHNVTSFTVESLADGTKVELFAAIAIEDDDARMTTLA